MFFPPIGVEIPNSGHPSMNSRWPNTMKRQQQQLQQQEQNQPAISFEEMFNSCDPSTEVTFGFYYREVDIGQDDKKEEQPKAVEQIKVIPRAPSSSSSSSSTSVNTVVKPPSLHNIIKWLQDIQLKRRKNGKYKEEMVRLSENNITWDCRAYNKKKIPEFTFKENSDDKNDPNKYDILVDISPKNTRKTEALVNNLKTKIEYDDDDVFRSCAIVPRKTLAVAYEERMNKSILRVTKRDVENYMNHPVQKKNKNIVSGDGNESEKKGNNYSLNGFHNVVVQFDSIDRVLTPQKSSKTVLPYTRGVCDEFRSTIRHISSDTMTSKNEMVTKFVQFIKLCETMVFMDADIDQECIDILSLMLVAAGKKDITVRINYNQRKTDTRKHVEYGTPAQFVDSMIGFLTDDWDRDMGQVVCPCNTINAAELLDEAIRKYCPNLKVLLITRKTLLESEEPVPIDKEEEDVEEQENTKLTGKYSTDKWKDYDVIIYTSVYLVGVSYTEPVCRVYAYFPSPRSNVAAECAQMGFRARTALEVHYYCTGDPKTDELVEWCPKIQNMIYEKAEYYQNVLKTYGDKATHLDVGDASDFAKSILGYISRANDIENRKSRQNLQREFRLFTLRHLESPDLLERIPKDAHYKPKYINYDEIRTTVADQNAQMIVDAEDIDDETANVLKSVENKDALSREEVDRLEKWTLLDFYKIDSSDLDVDFVKKWKPKMSSLRTFGLLFLTTMETINKRSEKVLEEKNYDSVYYLALDKELYKIFREMLKMFDFDLDKYDLWKFNFSENAFDVAKLNRLLMQVWARTKKKIFVQIKNPSYIGRWIQRFLEDIGVPIYRVYKDDATTKNDKEWQVNLPKFREVLLRLQTKYEQFSLQKSWIDKLLEKCTQEKCEEKGKKQNEIKAIVSPPKPRKKHPEKDRESNRKRVRKHRAKKKLESEPKNSKASQKEKKEQTPEQKEQKRLYDAEYRAKRKEQPPPVSMIIPPQPVSIRKIVPKPTLSLQPTIQPVILSVSVREDSNAKLTEEYNQMLKEFPLDSDILEYIDQQSEQNKSKKRPISDISVGRQTEAVVVMPPSKKKSDDKFEVEFIDDE